TPLAARSRLTLDDLAGYPVVLNTVSGTTTMDLWPASIRPEAIEVANTDDWLAAIAAGKAVGVTTTATASVHPYPGIAYRPRAAAADPPAPPAWTPPPTHPAIASLVTLAREVVGYRPRALPDGTPGSPGSVTQSGTKGYLFGRLCRT